MKMFIAAMRIVLVQACLNCYPNEIPKNQCYPGCLIVEGNSWRPTMEKATDGEKTDIFLRKD